MSWRLWKLPVRIPAAGCLRGRSPAIYPTGASKRGAWRWSEPSNPGGLRSACFCYMWALASSFILPHSVFPSGEFDRTRLPNFNTRSYFTVQ